MSRHVDRNPSSDPLVILARHRVIRMEGETTQDHQVRLARAAGEPGQLTATRRMLRDAWRYLTTMPRRLALVNRRVRRRAAHPPAPAVADVAGQVLHAEVNR